MTETEQNHIVWSSKASDQDRERYAQISEHLSKAVQLLADDERLLLQPGEGLHIVRPVNSEEDLCLYQDASKALLAKLAAE